MYKRCQSKSRKTWHSLTSKAFFNYMYKVSQILFLLILFPYVTSWLLLGNIFHMPWSFDCFLQRENLIAGDVIVKMYYEEFPLEVDCSPIKLRSGWRRLWHKSRRTTTLFFASTFLCVIMPLAQISSNESKFIMTWTLNWKCSQRSYKCYFTRVYILSRRLLGSSSGMTQVFFERPRNFLHLVSLMISLTSGSKRPLSGIKWTS